MVRLTDVDRPDRATDRALEIGVLSFIIENNAGSVAASIETKSAIIHDQRETSRIFILLRFSILWIQREEVDVLLTLAAPYDPVARDIANMEIVLLRIAL